MLPKIESNNIFTFRTMIETCNIYYGEYSVCFETHAVYHKLASQIGEVKYECLNWQ